MRHVRPLDNGIGCASLRTDSVYQRLQPSLPVASVSGSALHTSDANLYENTSRRTLEISLEKLHICHS